MSRALRQNRSFEESLSAWLQETIRNLLSVESSIPDHFYRWSSFMILILSALRVVGWSAHRWMIELSSPILYPISWFLSESSRQNIGSWFLGMFSNTGMLDVNSWPLSGSKMRTEYLESLQRGFPSSFAYLKLLN